MPVPGFMQPTRRFSLNARSKFFIDNHPDNIDLSKSLTKLEKIIEGVDKSCIERLKSTALIRKNLKSQQTAIRRKINDCSKIKLSFTNFENNFKVPKLEPMSERKSSMIKSRMSFDFPKE